MIDERGVILLVEDNPAHAEFVVHTLESMGGPGTVHHVRDGEQALDYLHRRGNFRDPARSPVPSLILLDLGLPRIDGFGVLREVKADLRLRRIPVVVLTTSADEADLSRAYSHHANSYLVKPADFDRFLSLMADVGSYWLGWNRRLLVS